MAEERIDPARRPASGKPAPAARRPAARKPTPAKPSAATPAATASKPAARPAAKPQATSKQPPERPATQRPAATRPATSAATLAFDEVRTEQLVDDEAEDDHHPRRLMPRGVPSWLVSMAVHMLLLVVFGLMTFSRLVQEPPGTVLGARATEDAPLESVEFDQPEEMDLSELDMSVSPVPVVAPVAIDMNAVAAAAATEVTVNDMAEPAGITGEIGAMLGADAFGGGKKGGGAKGAAEFFGVKTTGERFCFVVDNSNSMNNGRFETAVYELVKSITNLSEEQQFYVIFYSDMAYPLFYPDPARNMVPATDANKQRLVNWLATVQRCLYTEGEEAMAMAIAMKPDVIYLLGDGEFGDKTTDKTVAMAGLPITIHTLGFNLSARGKASFEPIAATFNGTFRDVEVPPQMKAMEKQMNRPKNNQANGPWGIMIQQRKRGK